MLYSEFKETLDKMYIDYDSLPDNLHSTILKEMCRKVGVDADTLPDGLYSTYLEAICEKLGVSVDELPDRLYSTYLEAIASKVTDDTFTLAILGKTEQNTYTGKNLLDNIHSETIGNMVYTFDEQSGFMHMVGDFVNKSDYLIGTKKPITPGVTLTANAFKAPTAGMIVYGIRYYDESGNYSHGSTLYNFPAKICTDIASMKTITLPDDVYFIDVSIILNRPAVADWAVDIVFQPQVEIGTVATSYEPYCGGIPSPNPDYPQQINCVKEGTVLLCRGKNLLNKDTIQNGYIKEDGTVENVTWMFHSDYIDISGFDSVKYVNCQGSASNVRWVALYDENYSFVSGERQVGEESLVGEIAVPTSAKYIRVNVANGRQDVAMVIDGSCTDYSYEAYTQESQITVPCDLHEGDTWFPMTGKVVKATNKVVLDGTERYSINLTYHSVVSLTYYPKGESKSAIFMCSHGVPGGYGFSNAGCQQISFGNSNYPIETYWGCTTIEEWQAFLAEQYANNTPVTIVYKLETPIIEQYDPQPLYNSRLRMRYTKRSRITPRGVKSDYLLEVI